MDIHIDELLQATIDEGGSDLHIRAYMPPKLRVHGELLPIAEEELTEEDSYELCREMVDKLGDPGVMEEVEKVGGADFALAHPDGTRFRVSVFNTGKPIADKDIHKIWDSFYRADKSMSRAQGRFGLGLAVVVSIQRLQNMEYGVRNEPDGVTFWFDIEASDADLPDGEVAAT